MQAAVEATKSVELARALNDLDAAKKRVERDAKLVENETRKRLVADLLPVLDNFDRTIAAAEREGASPALLEGLTAVRSQLEAVLRGYGVERVDTVAQRFDPTFQDAVGVLDVTDPNYHDVVIDQIQPAYFYGSSLLRPAKVVVGRLTAR
jgi:molecular chaperone GrpE